MSNDAKRIALSDTGLNDRFEFDNNTGYFPSGKQLARHTYGFSQVAPVSRYREFVGAITSDQAVVGATARFSHVKADIGSGYAVDMDASGVIVSKTRSAADIRVTEVHGGTMFRAIANKPGQYNGVPESTFPNGNLAKIREIFIGNVTSVLLSRISSVEPLPEAPVTPPVVPPTEPPVVVPVVPPVEPPVVVPVVPPVIPVPVSVVSGPWYKKPEVMIPIGLGLTSLILLVQMLNRKRRAA